MQQKNLCNKPSSGITSVSSPQKAWPFWVKSGKDKWLRFFPLHIY